MAGVPHRGAALPAGLQGQPAAGLPRLQHQAGGLAGLAEEGPAGQGQAAGVGQAGGVGLAGGVEARQEE